jgi:hypothetical protein
MQPLLAAAATMPCAIFTALVLVVVGYWLLVACGLADLDLFHAAGVHVHLDADAGHGGHGGHDHGFLELLSLGKVPVTVLATLFVLLAWLFCLGGETLLRPSYPLIGSGWPLGLESVLAALVGMAVVGRLLHRLFASENSNRRERLIGCRALVTSLTVDERFGTATCLIEGDEILLHVVVRGGRRLAKGDGAMVVAYDEAAAVHVLEPLDPAAGPPLPASRQPGSPERT